MTVRAGFGFGRHILLDNEIIVDLPVASAVGIPIIYALGAAAPLAPTGLTAGVPVGTTIPLTWNAHATATSFRIHYTTDGTTPNLLSPYQTVSSGSAVAADLTGLPGLTLIKIRLGAVNIDGVESVLSSEVSATTDISTHFFDDSFESGDFTHTENTGYWASATTISSLIAHTGIYSARSRHAAPPPGADIGDGPTQIDFGINVLNAGVYRRVWFEYYLWVPLNHFHADKSSRGKQTWANLSTVGGTTTITGPAGSFAANQKGMAIAIYGGGEAGDDGIVGYLHTIISDTQATLINIYRFKFAAGSTTVVFRADWVSQGVVAVIPQTAGPVSATKIRRSTNHKHFIAYGRRYSVLQQPHPFVLGELWAEKNTDPTFGDSFLKVRYYFKGNTSGTPPGSGNSLATAADLIPGVRTVGPGIKRGQWTLCRWELFMGSGPGVGDGLIKVWYNTDLMVNKPALFLWPENLPLGPTLTPYTYWDRIYMNGWVDGGFMEDTDYFIDRFRCYVSNPGW